MHSFPIFLSFDRKPPLVVGGGELAVVKARLLLKRARSVDLSAAEGELAPELALLVAAGLVTALPGLPPSAQQVQVDLVGLGPGDGVVMRAEHELR